MATICEYYKILYLIIVNILFITTDQVLLLYQNYPQTSFLIKEINDSLKYQYNPLENLLKMIHIYNFQPEVPYFHLLDLILKLLSYFLILLNKLFLYFLENFHWEDLVSFKLFLSNLFYILQIYIFQSPKQAILK